MRMLLLLLILSLAFPIASADPPHQITSEPLIQSINIGSSGNYTIAVRTDLNGTHKISFETEDNNITAKLYGQGNNTGDFSTSGSFEWNAPNTTITNYTFTLEVKPVGGVIGEEYGINVSDAGFSSFQNEILIAYVNAGVVPIPELATLVLMGSGIIGLIGIRRRYR